MNCPKCNEGIIKVLPYIPEYIGGCHHLICSKCCSFFGINSGSSLEREPLPPDFPIFFHKDIDFVAREEATRLQISLSDAFKELPTVEEFKSNNRWFETTNNNKQLDIILKSIQEWLDES